MKKLVSLLGVISAIFGLISCSTEVDESSIIGEWGVTEYTYNETEDLENGMKMFVSSSKFSDPEAKLLAFIFDKGGSGQNVCYGYYTDESQQFVDYYRSYPFKWNLNDGNLFLNYTAENPRDSKDSELKSHLVFIPVGTEFKASITGEKFILISDETIDNHKITSKIVFKKK